MGISSMPAPSDGVFTLILVNTAITISILKGILRSVLGFFGLHPFEPLPLPEDVGAAAAAAKPSLTDRFRCRFKPVRFGSLFCRRLLPVDRNPDCSVCLSRFEAESVVNRLPCGHLFHKACLETWLDYHHATCPLCRSRLLPAEEGISVASTSWPWF
ncbi:probable E3 ubiquitin-protein ligase XERICO [Typha latifolia]|uniref:probable E3 ubiquitin-protein ligase XERICO n=1 Tax=Typha latifolia TaxID=4733 RepID=UPI003C301D82